MYQLNGRMQTLAHARSQTEIVPTVNRVRRVIRDQISCGNELELQSLRYDVHLISPNNFPNEEAHLRHLEIVRPVLVFMLKSKCVA